MKKAVILGILGLAIIVILVGFLWQKPMTEGKVCFGDNCFSVELAKTPAEQQRGLMDRTELGQNRGMLFVFEQPESYPFWMMNTKIPLDIIWLDADQKVVFIKKNAQPCTEVCDPIDPEYDASYALEINGGISDQIGLKMGDQALINY